MVSIIHWLLDVNCPSRKSVCVKKLKCCNTTISSFNSSETCYSCYSLVGENNVVSSLSSQTRLDPLLESVMKLQAL